MNKLLPLLLTAAAVGCATAHVPLPMTAEELMAYDSAPALAAYLSQPDARPSVCNLHDADAHLMTCTPAVSRALVDGLVRGTIKPELWRRCATRLMGYAPVDAGAAFVEAVSRAYFDLLRDEHFEASAELQARATAIQELFLRRKAGLPTHVSVDGSMAADLGQLLKDHRLGALATKLATELLEIDGLEHGRLDGSPVEVPQIDALFAAGDEKTLRLLIAHLPQPELRDEARRRVLRLHIAASPYPEVTRDAKAVEETVLKRGVNRISVTEHPALSGTIDAKKVAVSWVWVRQDLDRQRATLLETATGFPETTPLPELSLRDTLQVQVTGISKPITLCTKHGDALDVTPCLNPHDVSIDSPTAHVDEDGDFHFWGDIPEKEAVALTRGRGWIVLPITVGGKPVASFRWKLHFERPADFVFYGPSPGTNGPNLAILADRSDPARFVFTVSAPDAQYLAVVEAPEVADFRIVSSGAQGYTGYTGAEGMPGDDGWVCHDGSPGGRGWPGGPGWPGGNGGDVAASVTCGGAPCGQALESLRGTILSVGGPGGAGGPGGRGGAGGSGGSGAAGDANGAGGCSAGSNGPRGADGPNGPSGWPGRPGTVTLVAAPAAAR